MIENATIITSLLLKSYALITDINGGSVLSTKFYLNSKTESALSLSLGIFPSNLLVTVTDFARESEKIKLIPGRGRSLCGHFRIFLSLRFYVKSTPHCGKTRNSISVKKNCEITSLVSSLVKPLLSQNFCQKVWEDFRNFHTLHAHSVEITKIPSHAVFPHRQSRNYGKLLSHIFDKNFVKVTFLLKTLLKNWFHRKFFGEREFRFFHTVTTWRKTSNPQIFHENIYYFDL